jgi:hypothetical protein
VIPSSPPCRHHFSPQQEGHGKPLICPPGPQEELRRIDRYKAPGDKLQCVVRAASVVFSALEYAKSLDPPSSPGALRFMHGFCMRHQVIACASLAAIHIGGLLGPSSSPSTAPPQSAAKHPRHGVYIPAVAQVKDSRREGLSPSVVHAAGMSSKAISADDFLPIVILVMLIRDDDPMVCDDDWYG